MAVLARKSDRETRSPELPPWNVPASDERDTGNPSVLDALQVASLMANMDASLRVHARAQFFKWTQGLLQGLIKHEVLVCALGSGEPLSLRVDSFSTSVPDSAIFSELFLRDSSVATNLVKAWKERRLRPVICEAADLGANGGGAFVRELQRLGASLVVAHGMHDVHGQAASFFTFACRSGTVGPAQAYLLELAVPFLHSAWIRTKIDGTAEDDRPATAGAGVLTAREQEILRWIYLGKSNYEVGTILQISPLTVKNHVQKILRKLNVVNRTQAVGKALETRILTP